MVGNPFMPSLSTLRFLQLLPSRRNWCIYLFIYGVSCQNQGSGMLRNHATIELHLQPEWKPFRPGIWNEWELYAQQYTPNCLMNWLLFLLSLLLLLPFFLIVMSRQCSLWLSIWVLKFGSFHLTTTFCLLAVWSKPNCLTPLLTLFYRLKFMVIIITIAAVVVVILPLKLCWKEWID